MNMHKKYITPSQRVIAYVLLFSQLLTSCGLNEKILPMGAKGADTKPASSARLSKAELPSLAGSAVKALNVPSITNKEEGGLQLDKDENALCKSVNDRSKILAYFNSLQLNPEQAALQVQDASQRLYEITKKGKKFIANVYTQDRYKLYQSLPVVGVGNQELMQILLQYPTFPRERIQLVRCQEGLQVYVGFQGLKGGMLRNWLHVGQESRSASQSSHARDPHERDTLLCCPTDSTTLVIDYNEENLKEHSIEDQQNVEEILESPRIAVKRELELYWLFLDTLFDLLQILVTSAKQGLIDTLLFKYGVLSFINLAMAVKDLGEDLYTEGKYHYYSGNTCFPSNAKDSTPPTIPVTSTLRSTYRCLFLLYKYGSRQDEQDRQDDDTRAKWLNTFHKAGIFASEREEAQTSWKCCPKQKATSAALQELEQIEIAYGVTKTQADLETLRGYYSIMNKINEQQDTFSFVNFEHGINQAFTLAGVLSCLYSLWAAIYVNGGMHYFHMLYTAPSLKLLEPFFIGSNGLVTLGIALIKLQKHRGKMDTLWNTLNHNIYQEAKRSRDLYQKIEQIRLARHITTKSNPAIADIAKMIGKDKIIDEQTWSKINVTINKDEIPAITANMLRTISTMLANKEEPILILDPGISMQALDEKLKASESISLQKFQDHTWYGESFAKTHGKVQWIVMPTSDGGLLPGSRNTAYTDQVKYMQQTHPPFSVLKGRELAVAVIGSALVNPDNRLLFDRPGDGQNQGKGWGEARCEELWSATGSSSSLGLSMGKFNQAGLQVTKNDNKAYTDCGLASGVRFSKTTANTSFTMNRAALMNTFKSKLAIANIDYNNVLEISKANFNNKPEPALVASYEAAYKIFLDFFNTFVNGKYKRMLEEVVQEFSETNVSRFDINEPAGIGLYEHLVFQVLAHLLQSNEVPDNSIAIFFRTPKEINLRIWISLAALAEICKKVPEDPSKKIAETTWKKLTDTAEDQAWLKAYLEKYQGKSATIGVNKGEVFLNSSLNPCNDTDYTRLEEDEEIEKLILFKQSLRQAITQDASKNPDVNDVIRKVIHHALLHPEVCYKQIKQYMYFSSTIYDKLPDDFKVGMWHHQHHYMDAISRKEASGRYAIDTGGVTRTNVDEGETEIPRFSIIWE